MRPYQTLIVALLFLVPLSLAGCGNTQPTRFYVLSAIPQKPAPSPGQGAAIGVGPITIPQYLDRPQIVTRTGDNQLALGEFDHWGGNLDDNIKLTLASNLATLLETDRVSLFPWKDAAPIEYQVTIDIETFEANDQGTAVLSVFWSIINPKDGTVMMTMRRSSYEEPTGQGGGTGVAGVLSTASPRPYDAIAAAMSRDLEKLSRDIASAIAGLHPS